MLEPPPNRTLRVLFLASEADPLVKVGGLGDVAGSLPRALRALTPEQTGGYTLDVRLVLPFHAAIRAKVGPLNPVASFNVARQGGSVPAQASLLDLDGLPVYLISGAPIPQEGPVYSPDINVDAEKFVFFSMAALELARALNWQPDIVQANDWHTAAAAYALERLKRGGDAFFANTRSIVGVHNLPFMGAGSQAAMGAYGLPPTRSQRVPVWGRQFPLVTGMLTADRVIAVSPTYAQEILTPEFGCDLQDFLKTRQNALMGIINGLDTAAWDPATDTALPANFSVDDLAARSANKVALAREFGLNPDENIPLIISIGRLDQQKGVDLIPPALRELTGRPWQAIILGSGDPRLEEALRRLEAELPDRVRAAIRFDMALSRRMYAGADMLLMPSRYEPCGLAQMIAMRYGCAPVARATGGLRDTIQDGSTGFLFASADSAGLALATFRALDTYAQKDRWLDLQRTGMRQNFSWENSALQYAHTFLELRS